MTIDFHKFPFIVCRGRSDRNGDVEKGRLLGTKYGQASRIKQAERCKRSVIATNIQTGKETHFESAAEVERTLGINHTIIPRICRGRQNSSKGYTFRYVDNGRDRQQEDEE